jgi:hypothetical protein
LVKLSLMRYKNGLSQMNGGKRIIILLVMAKAVAAAASDPSSLTSMKAFWTTAEVYNSASGSVIPESQKKTRNLFGNLSSHCPKTIFYHFEIGNRILTKEFKQVPSKHLQSDIE